MKKIIFIGSVVLVVGIAIGLLTPKALYRYRISKQLRAAEALVSKNGKDPWSYNVLGSTRFAAGDHAGAIEAYRQALELDPKHINAYEQIGGVYLYDQDWKNAELWFKKGLAAAEKSSPEDIPNFKRLLMYVEIYGADKRSGS
ncbi:MAG: tetratricopeptide repeat protein [Kiritimatiellales bacterium]